MPAWGGGVGEFFAYRENNDLILCVFSAPSSWLCIQSFVGTAPASDRPSSILQMLTAFISSISEIRSAASPGGHSPSSGLRTTTREDAWL